MSDFSRVVGQTAAVKVLRHVLNTGKAAHAYLFTGPSGVGKRLTAAIFAQGLNCENKLNKPCGVCLSCQKSLHDNHPDVVKLKPMGQSFRIEQVRQLQKLAHTKVYEGEYKVFILEDMHKATLQASNSLLKILEEPPGNAVFILITENPQAIPATVLSRCQKINFAPLASATIQTVLERHGYSGERVPLAANLAFGSLGHALEIVEDEQLFKARNYAFQYLQGALSKDYFRIYKAIESYEKDKLDMGQFLEQLLFLLRDAFRRDIGVLEQEAELAQALNLSQSSLQQALQFVLVADEWKRKQANNKLILDVLGLRLANLA
ncbi:MAG: DNA polymerase III subunit delta' [Peptococcaceae bacterium]|nr:DNA polymerase III subunit delta' [Peptococcaceae bacterium]